MQSITMGERGLSKVSLLTALLASITVHLLVLAAALVLPGMGGQQRTHEVPFYTVNLVAMQDAGDAVAPVRRANGDGATASRSGDRRAEASKPKPRSVKPTAVVPLRRLQFEEKPQKSEEGLSKLESPDVPGLSSPATDPDAIERNLEKLTTKPKPAPKPVHRTTAKDSSNARGAGDKPDEKAASTASKESAGGAGKADGKAAGSQASAEGSPDGAQIGLARRLYYTEVWNAIRRQWALPEFMKSQQWEAVVVVTLKRSGKIVDIRFEKRSGNSLFDESVVRAIRKADPLPPFPDIYSPPEDTIGVRFRPEDLS